MMATPVKKWLLRVAPWFLPVGIVAVWQLASSVGWLSTRILPSPEGVVTAFWTLSASGELWQHLAISSWRALIGFSIGGSLGLILGLISGLSRWGERLLDTSIQMLRNVPHLALLPLVILWFGIDESAKIFLVALEPGLSFEGGHDMNTARLNQGTPLLLNAVSKHYAENIVLNQLDLHIPAGQFVAVVGRSGGGKSTLLRLLAGLETPTAGDVLAGTTPLAEIQDDTRMMFQDARLLPWKSVIDNVGLGLKGQWRDAARRALAAVGLENRAGEWPAALSGGQKQRVALARALIHRPGLLLLDEPLGALDALTRLEMQDLIVSLWQQHGFTVLLVTHDVSEAVAMADRVLLIEEGKIGLDLTVDIPRPRRLGSVRLAELEAEVLQRVMRRGHSEQLIRRHG